ncbi:MAG: DUF6134 family protein [Burkholderiales bacterium]
MNVKCLLLMAALLPGIALANSNQEWRFRVLIDDAEVGTHTFRVNAEAGERRVESDARFNVKVWFINAYTYTHQARERWQGECLQDIEARTDDNGAKKSVRGARSGAHFALDNERMPACLMSFAYWNPVILKQTRLLNAQTGELTDVRIEPLGEESIQVRGTPTSARRYALHAPKFRIDLWYVSDSQWVRLESRTDSGRMLRYFIQ